MMLNDILVEIDKWAIDRDLQKANSDKQLNKLVEEVGELCQGHNKKQDEKVADAIGDIFVVMAIYCLQNDISFCQCIELAYNTIKDRKGKTIDGTFIKEQDLGCKMNEEIIVKPNLKILEDLELSESSTIVSRFDKTEHALKEFHNSLRKVIQKVNQQGWEFETFFKIATDPWLTEECKWIAIKTYRDEARLKNELGDAL